MLNYIVYLPMCVDDYIHEEPGVYSVQNAYRSSTLHKNSAHEIKQTMSPFLFALPLNRKDYIFDVTNNFYAIINISVYIWQLPRRWKDSNDQYSGIGLGKPGTGSLRWKLSVNRYIIGD